MDLNQQLVRDEKRMRSQIEKHAALIENLTSDLVEHHELLDDQVSLHAELVALLIERDVPLTP